MVDKIKVLRDSEGEVYLGYFPSQEKQVKRFLKWLEKTNLEKK